MKMRAPGMPSLQLSCRHYHYSAQLPLPSSFLNFHLRVQCSLPKQGQEFLISIATSSSPKDPSTINRMINKFVLSSTKNVTLNTLSHLLSPSSSSSGPNFSFLVMPLYARVKETSWFVWNSKLSADVVALLYREGELEVAEDLISETICSFCYKERELVFFYCNLLNAHVKHKSDSGFCSVHDRLEELISTSSSTYVKTKAYSTLISGLCGTGSPREAENLIDRMVSLGLKPSVFEYRSVVEGYGRVGMYNEMLRSVDKMVERGYLLDVICSNMVLSSYGAHWKLSEMVSWLERMKSHGIGLSIRTFNSVLNSCPTIVSMSLCPEDCPVSMKEVMEILDGDDEGLLVKELMIGSNRVLVDKVMEWEDSTVWKLDLHGMHLAAAYLMLLHWMEELRSRFLSSRQGAIPAEVVVVCGLGKHSCIRGKPPVRSLVKELMFRVRSPLRIDRKNKGCFLAKGKLVKEWLLC